ncbi:MAG: metal ABC transporter ATP-binding protein [Candidatus Fermentibacter sp.]|nr:metal ABC transporter ATP-binding protein [Candidatus Fermentibacter sp.]
MTVPVVRLRGVTFGYGPGRPALDGVDFEVSAGDYVAVIGPNGGGKTTLLKVILGLRTPWSGTVEVFGGPPAAARGRIGYVPQWSGASLDFPATALDVVMMGLPPKTGGRAARAVALDRMADMGIAGLAGIHAGSLSGGQRQKVYVARALAGDPELLLLDEPAASVDPAGQGGLYDLLARLNEKVTIVLVTHDVGAVSGQVRSIACLNSEMVSHGGTLDTEALWKAYGCPVDLVSHGTPHRVLEAGAHGGCGHA